MTYANAAKKSKRIEELLVAIKELSPTAVLTGQATSDIMSLLNEYKNIIDRALNENFEISVLKKKGEE